MAPPTSSKEDETVSTMSTECKMRGASRSGTELRQASFFIVGWIALLRVFTFHWRVLSVILRVQLLPRCCPIGCLPERSLLSLRWTETVLVRYRYRVVRGAAFAHAVPFRAINHHASPDVFVPKRTFFAPERAPAGVVVTLEQRRSDQHPLHLCSSNWSSDPLVRKLRIRFTL